jgi:hypothetical protein
MTNPSDRMTVEGLVETCPTCSGNGEIVTEWDRYLEPRSGDAGDEAVAECPDCAGIGLTLIGRLNAKTHCAVRAAGGPQFVNPDGPEAAERILGLTREIEAKDEALAWIAGHDAAANGLTGFAAELVDNLTSVAGAALRRSA